jgi:hypothetical protein
LKGRQHQQSSEGTRNKADGKNSQKFEIKNKDVIDMMYMEYEGRNHSEKEAGWVKVTQIEFEAITTKPKEELQEKWLK